MIESAPDPEPGRVVSIGSQDGPPGEAFESWCAAADTMLPLTMSNPVGELNAMVQAQWLGPLMVADVACSRLETRRTPRDIARGPLGAVYVFEQLHPTGSAFHTAGHPDGLMAAGDMMLGDIDAPFESLTKTEFGHRLWIVPRSFVDLGAGSALEEGVRLARRSPMGRLISAYLRELQAAGSGLDPAAAHGCVEVAGRLLAVAAGGDRSQEPFLDALAHGQLATVKRRVEQRLTDPLLSPSRMAGDCGMSVRKLHALFEPTGVTFSAFVTARRLEIARTRLADPGGLAESVTDVAFSLGFNSLSTFYRAYRHAFGEAPGEIRMRAAFSW